MRCWASALAILAASLPMPGVAGTRLTACVEVFPWEPYTYPDHDGELQRLIRRAAADLDVQVEFVAMPWRRCEQEVQGGRVDAAVGVPEIEASSQRFALPAAGGRPDPARALVEVPMVVLRPAGSPLGWDGRRLTGLRGRVLYPYGYEEVEARLEELHLPGDGGGRTNAANATKLLSGRSNAMVAYRFDAQRLVQSPQFAGRLEILPVPFALYRYHLAFGRRFYEHHRGEVEALWERIAAVRRQPAPP